MSRLIADKFAAWCVNLAVINDFTQIKVDGEWKDCTFTMDTDNINVSEFYKKFVYIRRHNE